MVKEKFLNFDWEKIKRIAKEVLKAFNAAVQVFAAVFLSAAVGGRLCREDLVGAFPSEITVLDLLKGTSPYLWRIPFFMVFWGVLLQMLRMRDRNAPILTKVLFLIFTFGLFVWFFSPSLSAWIASLLQ